MGLYNRDYMRTQSIDRGYMGVADSASVDFMKRTYQLLAASMLAAAVGAFVTMPYSSAVIQYRWFIFGAELLILFFGLGMSKGKPGLNLFMLFAFTFLTGVSLVPLLSFLIGRGSGGTIGTAFLMTAVLFGSLSIFAINSKQDFSNWGKPLFIVMIVVIIASFVNYFIMNSPIMHIIITVAILLLFSLFTIYDTQNIANGAYDSEVDAAVSLYLDSSICSQYSSILGTISWDD